MRAKEGDASAAHFKFQKNIRPLKRAPTKPSVRHEFYSLATSNGCSRVSIHTRVS